MTMGNLQRVADRRPVVFLCDDYMMEESFEAIAQGLLSCGVEVIRGPRTQPGPKLQYPRSSYAELFARADVAMFSSRSLCTAEIMDAAPRLRGIVNPSAGLETVDVAAASARGILVGHATTTQARTALAEATVMLILMQLYNPNRSREVLLGTRPRPAASASGRWATLLTGRTVGLVGLGRIGREVAQRLQGFNVRVIAAGRPGAARDPGSVPDGVEMVELDTLLRESDIVSLHVTVTAGASPLIGERELGLMKPTAHLINTARGEAVDEDSLYRFLKSRRIAGAALDTFRVEPLPDTSPLRELDNVFLTPHLVAQTRDSFAIIPGVGIENVTRLLRGEPPLYCKNPDVIHAWRPRVEALGGALIA